ncbi:MULTISPECIES: histidine phosphatase family protein [Synergistaceae]|uniref:histidine phosphatase family protein n=1 Tax=Synergistaceae TaxID=649777 RepID=UPI003AE58472|nr:histidine phosphatase family protein [Synergistaceae bacterium DZ-S4]
MNNGEKQKIYLIRHAKPDLPHGGKLYYGSTDYPLSEEGVMMAKRLAEVLRGVEANMVFSSDLRRARETAEIALAGRTCEIRPVRGLREIHLGDWEGRSFDEVRLTWNEIYEKRGVSFDSVGPPGGESFKDLQKRTVPVFDEILRDNPCGNIMLFAHGGVIWTLMCNYFGFKLNDIFFYPMDFCGIHLIERSDGLMKLIKYNWSRNLS